MAYYSTTLTDTTTSGKICDIIIPEGKLEWTALLLTGGSGSNFAGTSVVNYYYSADRGSSLIPVKTTTGTAYTASAADSIRIAPGGHSGNNSTVLRLYAQLTNVGAGASIKIEVFDNRG